MSERHGSRVALWGCLAAVVGGAASGAAQEGKVLPVATCEQLSPRELRVSVTFFNCGERLELDYTAFVHFDRARAGESLYMQPAPGLRPLVAPTRSSSWSPNETTTVDFGAVTVPASARGEVFVKVGLYDAGGSGGRLPLAGEDASRRVLVGSIVEEDGQCRWVRRPPAAGEQAEWIGARPRALVKALPVEPAVRFGEADPRDWSVEGLEGGSATLERTREELCWSEASLKVGYVGGERRSGFVLRPKVPLPVPEEADVARLWLLGRALGWVEERTPEMPLLRYWVELQDGEGQGRRLQFPGAIAYPYWYVARARIPREWPRPLVCTGVGFDGCTNTRARSLLLDALVFAKETPAPELSTSVSLEDLPFPTSPDGLLPDTPRAAFSNRVEADGDAWRLVYEGADEKVTYRYTPLTGTLDDVEATWERGEASENCRLAAEGGPLVELGGRRFLPASPGVRRTRVSLERDENSVRTVWRCEAGGAATEYALSLSVRGKSLLVEIEGTDEALTGFSPGHFESAAEARFVPVPYWSWGVWDYGRDGGVVVTDHLFVSGYPDWYRSRASGLTFGADLSHRVDSLAASALTYVPGVKYDTRSHGRRNVLRERYVLTVSSELRETLPNIPHPPSPNREKLAAYCHYTGGRASLLAEQLEHWQRLHSYGVEKVYIRHFDGMWSDVPQGPQEWTLTEHAAPVAGDVAVKRYLEQLQAMGFLPVLYTNYTDLQPVAADFEWDNINLLPDGDISAQCWPGSYPLKPLRAVELEARYAPRIAGRFGTQGSFCDVHTAAAPWGKVDFDARLAGAAQFGTTYRCYGKLLMNERASYGAVYSEGSMHWLYAGLADGSDAQIRSPHPHLEPFLVDFDLLKIHPLEMDAGMSWISRYVDGPDAAASLGGWEAAQDRYTAATVAYGHQGTFTGLRFRDYDTDIKTYYLLQPLQKLYALCPVEEIRYRDPESGRMLGTSEAVRSGIYRESQVYVRYANGLRVWVNGSLAKDWPVEAEGAGYALPPSGFLAQGPEGMLVYSAAGAGGRVDVASQEGTWFVDARGKRQVVGPADTDGAAILKRSAEGVWSLWPLGKVTVLRVDAGALGLGVTVRVTACDEAGTAGGDVETTVEEGRLVLPTDTEVFRFEIAGR